MTNKSNPPSISETAFECPHCGAFTTQHWFTLTADQRSDDSRTPHIPSADFGEGLEKDKAFDPELLASLVGWAKKMNTGLVFFNDRGENRYKHRGVSNLHLSECYNCRKIAVWVHDSLVFPAHKEGALPNSDLPDDITMDFEEARSIIGGSPRGAAALLRLCIQKVCAHLGEKGKNIDDDIGSLVAKGLNPLVQQSLDVVRVIGNEAVHPGTMDLRDDRDTALRLLGLVNLIADQMISQPKAIRAMYEGLPEAKRSAIEQRDGRAHTV